MALFEHEHEIDLPAFADLCKALRSQVKEAYDKAASDLLEIGYLPSIDTSGRLSVTFCGPIATSEKREHTEYLNSLYEELTSEHKERNEEDEDRKGYSAFTFILLLIAGVIGVVAVDRHFIYKKLEQL